ncbi:type VI secretion system protein TssL, long form [Lysobacter sp. BMK333-48F3]|uniref:type VI secretion system protein TssL, long form n=1 Tax=Lysobacter sp. BMK333-48F3 TaxID=2867962 RepID=UPI001C8B976E|nr:type VI secretion system protein TssL, long form [Lysobacter sp. BMK333-48F3]MBX9403031.1 type VI secretion system protein TssL, long form [Lysobacter sp. BMK333-48F3]
MNLLALAAKPRSDAALPSAADGTDPSALPDRQGGSNPLVAAANPLLDLLPTIRRSKHHDSPERLREYLAAQVRRFQTRAQQADIPLETIVAARYCLCTALDEAAALTPWGGGGLWSAHSLLVTFHNETWGGEKFFQLLARLSQQPHAHRQILELQYFCLALGFQGRYRIVPNGQAQVENVRERLLKLLRETGSPTAAALAPNWRAAAPDAEAKRRWMPAWVWLVLAALLGCGAYIGFLTTLQGHGDRTYAAINAIALPKLDTFVQATRLTGLLADQLADDRISVVDEADRSVVTIRGDGLFDSGSAQLKDGYLATIQRIGSALNSAEGTVRIIGHTDSQPIHNQNFASNTELSQARADAVRNLLVLSLQRSKDIQAVGLGAEQPVADNASAEGRARNRRVEIILQAPAQADQPQP